MVSKIPHYCVVGGGLTGLSTAYLLSLIKLPGSYRITLLESSPRFGGWIHSFKNPKTGAIYDLGPHSARYTSDSMLLRLAARLKLQDSIVWLGSTDEASRRLLYLNGRIVPISRRNLSSILSKSPLRVFVGSLLRSRPATWQSDVSVDEFFRTRLNAEVADILVSALMRGIYAGDSRNLGVRACIPLVTEFEERGPNLILGAMRSKFGLYRLPESLPGSVDRALPYPTNITVPKGSIAWSLHGGMQTLTDALVAALQAQAPEVSLLTNASVNCLNRSGPTLTVRWVDQAGRQTDLTDIDSIFLCCPSYRAAPMLRSVADEDTIKRLQPDSLPWTDVAVGVMELEAEGALPAQRGFGHLVPRSQDPLVHGVIYDSIAFPQLDSPAGSVRYTVMMKPKAEWLRPSSPSILNAQVTAECQRVLREHLSLSNVRPIDTRVTVLRNCIPQYPVNHQANVASARAGLARSLGEQSATSSHAPGIHLVGVSYDGVSLPDAVRSAVKAVGDELRLRK